MKKKMGSIKKFFSLFSYKEKEYVSDFHLPEVNESGDTEDIQSENSSQNVGEQKAQDAKAQQSEKQGSSQQADTNKKQSQDKKNKTENEQTGKANQATKSVQKENTQEKQNAESKENGVNQDGQGDSAHQSGKQDVPENEKEQKANGQNKSIKYKRIKKPITVSELIKKNEQKKEKVNLESKETGNINESPQFKSDIQSNMDLIRREFNFPTNSDLVIREFLIDEKTKAFLVYMEGMVDRITINNFILAPILRGADKFKDASGNCQLDFMLENVLETNQVKKINKIDDVVKEIVVGDTGIYVDGCDYLIFCETKGYEKRSVSTPQIESVVRGSQEAFSENLRTNITLLRRIIKCKDFTTEFLTVGSRNSMNVAIAYLSGVANPAIVKEVKRRLNGISTDFVGSAGMLEQFIEDKPFSIIPTMLETERPDRAADHIFEGKLAIIVDGTPFSIVVPVTIATLFHSPEDSSLRWQYSTMLRFIRIFAIFVASMLPGLYVALINFHKEMIPTDLLIAIAKAKENVPFPAIVEVIIMEISFELIREAGIRIPGIVGNTIGIIGALILGQAAVQANLVSPTMIIVVAFTGLGNFAIPDFSLAFGIRIIRVAFIATGALLGFYGISLTLVALGYSFVSLKSFGVPFFTSFAPSTRKSHDMLIRWPIWKHEFRPDNVNPLDVRRQPDISRKWTREKPATISSEEGNDE